MTKFAVPIAEQIWDAKYRLKQPDGTPIDITVEDTWHRIANALAVPEGGDNEQKNYAAQFYDALEDWKYLPAGRITAGTGTGRNVTLFNCYVMGTIPDSMDGIFEMLKEAALTMQAGGGIGYDFSTIRPKGAPVVGVGSDASGPLTFMDCWDTMCTTIMSAGSRRGAMMATMRCDHPDIFDFIHAKKDPTKLRRFNVSVLITDKFMEALENQGDWDLVFKGKVYRTVPAQDLWDAIMTSTYNQAEPGVIFIDRINQMNNLYFAETIAATNPCGEQPLPPYGACLLGSVNLAKMVKYPFTSAAEIDYPKLKMAVINAVRMMDNTIDVSKFPLIQQEAEARFKRRIGLGVTGVADMFLMLGCTYGSVSAERWLSEVLEELTKTAYETSLDLARTKGPAPIFKSQENKNLLANSHFLKRTMSEEFRDAVREHGLRNSHLTSIAPTGTISLYAGNVSSGIEPVFAWGYNRKVLEKDGSHRIERVEDYACKVYREWCEDNGKDIPDFENETNLPPHFVTAQTLSPLAHLRMQAVAQRWIDSSISKTINLPEDISYEKFKKVYLDAFHMGCKGCTTYRPNDITGSVISVDKKEDKKEEAPELPIQEKGSSLPKRQSSLKGRTYKLKPPGEHHAMYVTLTEQDGRPYELFINSKNMEHFVWTVGLTRMISAVFRLSDDSHFVVEELKAVFDPKGGFWDQGKYVPSILAAIGGIVETFMKEIGYTQGKVLGMSDEHFEEVEAKMGLVPNICPKCSGTEFKKESGCETCLSCGHSKCG